MTKSTYDESIVNAELAQRALLEQRDDAVRKQVDYQSMSEQQRAQTPAPPEPASFDASLRQNEALLENLKAAREAEIRAQPQAPEAPPPQSQAAPQLPTPEAPQPTLGDQVVRAHQVIEIVDAAVDVGKLAAGEAPTLGILDPTTGALVGQTIEAAKPALDHGPDYLAALAVTTMDQTIGDNRLAEANKQIQELDKKHGEETAKLDQKLDYAKDVQEQRIAEGLTKNPEAARDQMQLVAEAARAELAQRQAAEMAELARQLQQREQVRQMADPARDFR